MSGVSQTPSFFIGWDVGGWNCDHNGKSRDAIVILDSTLAIVGKPWRGNLRTHINESTNANDWIRKLFALCAADQSIDAEHVALAIDTPLGFSEEFVSLVTGLQCVGPLESSDTNSYLFRQTERYLFEQGLKPLSAIKDMIGSQATKGMHVLAKFAPITKSCGVWTDGGCLTAIEAYPSVCKDSALFQELLKRYLLAERVEPPERVWSGGIDHPDKLDALICALIAYVFTFKFDALSHPTESIPMTEGWIWVPKDALRPDMSRHELID